MLCMVNLPACSKSIPSISAGTRTIRPWQWNHAWWRLNRLVIAGKYNHNLTILDNYTIQKFRIIWICPCVAVFAGFRNFPTENDHNLEDNNWCNGTSPCDRHQFMLQHWPSSETAPGHFFCWGWMAVAQSNHVAALNSTKDVKKRYQQCYYSTEKSLVHKAQLDTA